MKKIVALLLYTLMLISCSGDDSAGEEAPTFDVNKLLGKWSYDEYIIDGVRYPYVHQENCNRDYFGFRNRPGQEYQYEELFFTNSDCAVNQLNMEWKAVGNLVKLNFGEYPAGQLVIIELTDTKLHYILQADVTGDGVIDELELIAIPHGPYDSY